VRGHRGPFINGEVIQKEQGGDTSETSLGKMDKLGTASTPKKLIRKKRFFSSQMRGSSGKNAYPTSR